MCRERALAARRNIDPAELEDVVDKMGEMAVEAKNAQKKAVGNQEGEEIKK